MVRPRACLMIKSKKANNFPTISWSFMFAFLSGHNRCSTLTSGKSTSNKSQLASASRFKPPVPLRCQKHRDQSLECVCFIDGRTKITWANTQYSSHLHTVCLTSSAPTTSQFNSYFFSCAHGDNFSKQAWTCGITHQIRASGRSVALILTNIACMMTTLITLTRWIGCLWVHYGDSPSVA